MSERIELECFQCGKPYTLDKAYYEKFSHEILTKICSVCEARINSKAWDD